MAVLTFFGHESLAERYEASLQRGGHNYFCWVIWQGLGVVGQKIAHLFSACAQQL